MLIITASDILCFRAFIDRTIKNEETKKKLTKALSLGKPAISKGLLLLLLGADFNFIQNYTRMPAGYFARFLDNFYDLQGMYPQLIFVYPAFRTDPEIMRQVYFTAGFKEKFDFLKKADKVMAIYDRLTKVAGKIIVPPEEKKPIEAPDKSAAEKTPTEYLDKLDEINKLDTTAEEFLSKYDYIEKVQFIEAMNKNPAMFVEKLFGNKKGNISGKVIEDKSKDKTTKGK